MFEGHILLISEVNQWFLNDIAQKFWNIMKLIQNMINSHDVQLVNWYGTGPLWWQPGCRGASALDIYETLDGDGCGRWQRPQPVEDSERGGPLSCPQLEMV